MEICDLEIKNRLPIFLKFGKNIPLCDILDKLAGQNSAITSATMLSIWFWSSKEYFWKPPFPYNIVDLNFAKLISPFAIFSLVWFFFIKQNLFRLKKMLSHGDYLLAMF